MVIASHRFGGERFQKFSITLQFVHLLKFFVTHGERCNQSSENKTEPWIKILWRHTETSLCSHIRTSTGVSVCSVALASLLASFLHAGNFQETCPGI